MMPRQDAPDTRLRCESCHEPIDPDEPVYRDHVYRAAHVRCPLPTEAHAFASATHVGQPLLGNYMRPAGAAMWICRCGSGFAADSDFSAKDALARHLQDPASTPVSTPDARRRVARPGTDSGRTGAK